MKTILHPLNDRVVIKRVAHEEKSKGGLYIPESAKEKPHKGVVQAVGEKTALKVGDMVMFGKYAGIEMIVDEETLIVLKEEDVVAKVEMIVEDSDYNAPVSYAGKTFAETHPEWIDPATR